ncbi:MAG: hypothetical protein NZM37_10220, partial [Sandaracinaceae bacterium]|nr:hypothetical protein [Sandaracinaceae bacterium]
MVSALISTSAIVLSQEKDASESQGSSPEEIPLSKSAGSFEDELCRSHAENPPPGQAATKEELLAACLAEVFQRFVRAREKAEQIIAKNPNSYVAHYVLGLVHHYGEGNFARALFHLKKALGLFAQSHGSDHPTSIPSWRWHASILRELFFTSGALERYEDQLRWAERYNGLYSPPFQAELAWPLMKLRRFGEARRAAELGKASGNQSQIEIALNALCATEFEAGNEERSYQACREALELYGADPKRQSAVDFTNFAEASRSLFRLEEAEEYLLAGTKATIAWYGNPFVDLVELYIREGRFAEALSMMRQVHPYRAKRPPHVQEADRTESRRALAQLFLVLGRGEDAMRVTEKAMRAPDRRGHNSRDPAQDLAITALLDRAALLLRAQEVREAMVGASLWEKAQAFFDWIKLRIAAWASGRKVARALSDNHRLVGILQIGRASSAATPPWLVGDLIEIMGAGVIANA